MQLSLLLKKLFLVNISRDDGSSQETNHISVWSILNKEKLFLNVIKIKTFDIEEYMRGPHSLNKTST